MLEAFSASLSAKYFGYILLQLQHPELASRDKESWAEHLARLEEHHTSGVLRGPEIPGNFSESQRGGLWRSATSGTRGDRGLQVGCSRTLEFSNSNTL
jgi:hypothetical protein